MGGDAPREGALGRARDTVKRWRSVWARFRGRGTYPHELAFLLRLPLRSVVLSRRELVRRLDLAPDARVLEIGPGPGFFSGAVARGLPRGRLELLDVQVEMLRKARRAVAAADASRVGFVQASAERLPFAPGSFDRVFLVAVLGEVPRPGACVAEVARILRPGGRLSITELPGDPDALSLDEVERLGREHGLEPAARHRKGRGFTVDLAASAR